MRNIITIGVLTTSMLFVSQVQAATDLSSLSAEAQEAVTRLCSPVQYREGAGAYRRCVQSEIESMQAGGKNGLAELSFDDKYAVQQYCATSGNTHQSCVSSQVASVRNVATPTMSNITDDEQYAIQQSCFTAQSTLGLLAYRQCVLNEIASLEQIPRIKLDALPVLERNALQLRCSANSTTAAAYRQCLAIEYASFSNSLPTYQPTAVAEAKPAVATKPAAAKPVPVSREIATAVQDAVTTTTALPTSNSLPRNIEPQRAGDTITSASKPVDTSSTINGANTAAATTQITAAATTTPIAAPATRVVAEPAAVATPVKQTANQTVDASGDALKPVATPRIISRPNLAEQVAEAELESTNTTQQAAPGAGIKSVLEGLKDKFNSLTSLGKAVAAVVLALPLLLLGLKRLLSGKRTEEEWESRYEERLSEASPRNNTEAIKARWDEDLEDLTMPMEPLADNTPTERMPDRAPRAAADITATHLSSENIEDTTATRFVQRPSRATASSASTDARWQSGFGKWLESEPVESRQQHCVEFLIYWMAYGDERYEQSLKERLFSEQNPSASDQIKRWVLKQDVFAFADTMSWIKRNTSKIQQEQILDLLMALLVTENSITPSQNVILRMLADTFGIGADALQKQFGFAYGEELPPFPRTDKQSWWLEQRSEAVMRWDARQVAALPEREQMLARLGLDQQYSESDVVKAFRRAARRCHPDRFSQLGSWEHRLAQRQYERFEEARDILLGVSV